MRSYSITLAVVKTTAARVPKLRVAVQRNVTITIAPTAVSLIAHCGIESGEASAPVLCQNKRFEYSAKIKLMAAFPPGERPFNKQ